MDSVNAALQDKTSAVGGGDVAGHELHVPETLAKRFDRAGHHRGVAMRNIDDDNVDLHAQQFRRPLQVIALRADRRTDPQTALRVTRGKGQLALRDEVLRGNQPSQRVVRIQQRKLLDLVRSQHLFGLRQIRLAGMGNQPVARRHSRRDRAVLVRKPHVARRQQSRHPALLIDDNERADAGAEHGRRGIREVGRGRDGVGIADDAVLFALDDLDLAYLRVDLAAAEATVDDADPALLGHGHLRPRHGIHVRGDDRPLQRETPREVGREVEGGGVATLNDTVPGCEEEIVERAAADEREQIRHAVDSCRSTVKNQRGTALQPRRIFLAV